MKTAALILLTLCFLFSKNSFAQSSEMIERSFSGVSKETMPQAARKDIMDQAYSKVSEDVIKELIGEDKYQKNKTLIANKIIKNAPRYMPFSKPSDLVLEGEQQKMSVVIKISMGDLKNILQENSLLNENESTPTVLPVISLIDKVNGKSFRWWISEERDAKNYLQTANKNLEQSLRSSFQRNGFYLLKAQESAAVKHIPLAYQNEKLNNDDSQFLAQYFGSSISLDGVISISKNPNLSNSYRIELKVSATQISNDRPIADVSRKMDTEVGSFENVVDKKMKEICEAAATDLASQIFEAWQKGSIGTSTLRITLNGKIDLLQLEAFKEKIKIQVPQIRSVRERLFEANKYAFEVDTVAPAQELIKKLQGMELGSKKANQVTESTNEIIMHFN